MGARVRRGPKEAAVWPVERLEPLRTDDPRRRLLGGAVHRRRDAPGRLEAAPARRRAESDAHRASSPSSSGWARASPSSTGAQPGGEPVGDLEVEAAELVATSIGAEEVPALVDELPLFALAAGMAHGDSVVTGAQELRVKESDRVESVKDALRPLGIHIETRHGWLPGSRGPHPPSGWGRGRRPRRPPDRHAGRGRRARLARGRGAPGRRERRCKLPRLLPACSTRSPSR